MTSPRFAFPDTTTTAAPAPALDAAWADRLTVLRPLGFTEAILECRFTKEVLTFAGPGFETLLGEELTAADFGRFEELKPGQPFNLIFHLHTAKLSAALEFLRARLDRLKILPLCRIAFADCDSLSWRSFYPAPIAPGSEGAL